MIDDGAASTAEPVSAGYYELIGAKAGSNPISGTITEDLVVDLEYRVKDVTFTIEHRSTDRERASNNERANSLYGKS